MPRKDPASRFWPKVDRSGDCWLWLGAKKASGYGNFGLTNNKCVLAHRFSFELERGPIPEGLELDHLCRNPSCVNPEHLEPVTRAENKRRTRGIHLLSHCKRGHEFTADNTYVCRYGSRRCRECMRIMERVRYHRKKALLETSAGDGILRG